MTDAQIFDVTVELGLELAGVVCPHISDTEWEIPIGTVEEVDSVCLGVPAVNLEGPATGGIVDGGVLMMFNRFPFFFWKD